METETISQIPSVTSEKQEKQKKQDTIKIRHSWIEDCYSDRRFYSTSPNEKGKNNLSSYRYWKPFQNIE